MNVLKAYHDAADDQPRQAIQLELFRERLPAKPYHTDDLSTGLLVRSAERAALARYIQPNGPTHKYWLVYDIDRQALRWTGATATARRPRSRP